MNYEKKYKEAQKWVESIYPELSCEQRMEAEAFFPALKESADEKIRKWLVEQVERTRPASTVFKGIGRENVLAWLEKQGENPAVSDDVDGERTSVFKITQDQMDDWLKKCVDAGKQDEFAWSDADEERFLSCLKLLGTGNIEQPDTINTMWLKSIKTRLISDEK